MKRQNSPPITPEMAAQIKHLRKSKGLFQHQIAAMLGVNQGRISEVITGKRHPNIESDQGSLSL